MVADPLTERLELYRWELARLDRVLSDTHLPMDRRPNLERVRCNMLVLLQISTARLRGSDDHDPGEVPWPAL